MEVLIKETVRSNSKHLLAHWNEGLEVIYVVNGQVKCLIEGEEYKLREGSICVVNNQRVHMFLNETDNDCDIARLLINPEDFTKNEKVYKKYVDPVINDERFSHIIAQHNKTVTQEVINLMGGIDDYQRLKPQGYEMAIIALTHMIYQKIYMQYRFAIQKERAYMSADTFLYRKMVDYIYSNYDGKVTLDDIAGRGNVSRSKCCIIFKKFSQSSPIEFLNEYRLKVSTDLLKNTKYSIAHIAKSTGFGQSSYYNRLFLREYGMTPTEYRRKGQLGHA